MSFRPPQVIDPKTPVVKMSEENQNIQVFVRCRPLKPNEKKSHLELSTEKRIIKYSQQNKLYSFDNVFDAKAKQFKVYQSVVEPLVDQVTQGYNCTVFAYGQTGTGKTFTMVGDRSDMEVPWDEDPTSGMIPRAIDQLIDALASQNTEYTIRVSFLELYNEDAYDLLSPLSDTNKLRIYNDVERKGSVIISGLVELVVNTKAEIFEILEKGSHKRQTAPTLMNACSSRSHSIFSITVHIKETTLEGEEVVKMGKLNLVDLAGSENIGRSGAIEERAREASNINKSLLTLGRVITSLVDKSPHIPYRDSKLTRLLQDSLGGKTKTSIIATISPGFDDIEDTLSTLDYAQRAKKITNKPEVNLKMSKKTLISEYMLEIDRLRRDLEAARDKKGVYVDAKNFATMEATLKEQEQSLELKEAQIDQLQKDLKNWSTLMSEINQNYTEKCEEFENLKTQFTMLADDLKATRSSLEATKVEVEEQKVLVESHRVTEQKLMGQAKTILKVADTCVNDNQNLYRKIETILSLEQRNTQLLNNFNEEFGEQFGQLQQMGINITETIKDTFGAIEQSILDKRNAIEGKNTELHSTARQMQATVDSFSAELLGLLQKDMTVCQVVDSVKQVLSNFRTASSASIQASFESFVEKEKESVAILENLMADSIKCRREFEEKAMEEISRMNETTKHVTSVVRTIKEDLMNNYKEKCTQLEESRKENAQLKAKINAMQMDKKIQELTQKYAQELSQLCEEYSRNVEEIDEAMTNSEQQLERQIAKEGSFTSGLALKTDDLVSFIAKDNANVGKFLTELDQSKSTDCQNVLDKCKEVQTIQAQFENQFKASAQSIVAETESTTAEVDGQLSRGVSEAMEKSLTVKAQRIADLKRRTAEFTTANGAIITTMGSLLTESNEATLKEYKNMQSHCEAYRSSQDHQITHCLEMAQSTVSRYAKYQKTGMTPNKRSYEYPRELAATSPHERILSRFKSKCGKENASPFKTKSA